MGYAQDGGIIQAMAISYLQPASYAITAHNRD